MTLETRPVARCGSISPSMRWYLPTSRTGAVTYPSLVRAQQERKRSLNLFELSANLGVQRAVFGGQYAATRRHRFVTLDAPFLVPVVEAERMVPMRQDAIEVRWV